jgi:hypothetical protein
MIRLQGCVTVVAASAVHRGGRALLGCERGRADDQGDLLDRSTIGDQVAVLADPQHRHRRAAQRPLRHDLLDSVPIRADHDHHHRLRPSTLTGVEPVYRRELPGRIVFTIGLGMSGACIVGLIVLLVHG